MIVLVLAKLLCVQYKDLQNVVAGGGDEGFFLGVGTFLVSPIISQVKLPLGGDSELFFWCICWSIFWRDFIIPDSKHHSTQMKMSKIYLAIYRIWKYLATLSKCDCHSLLLPLKTFGQRCIVVTTTTRLFVHILSIISYCLWCTCITYISGWYIPVWYIVVYHLSAELFFVLTYFHYDTLSTLCSKQWHYTKIITEQWNGIMTSQRIIWCQQSLWHHIDTIVVLQLDVFLHWF